MKFCKYTLRATAMASVLALAIAPSAADEKENLPFLAKQAVNPRISTDGAKDACEDLVAAACKGKDGKSRHAKQSQIMHDKLFNLVTKARDKTAQALGYQDTNEALQNRLKAAGIELKDKLDPKLWRTFLADDAQSGVFDEDRRKPLYASVERCQTEWKGLDAIDYERSNVNNRKTALGKIEHFIAKYRTEEVRLWAKDLGHFVDGNIGTKCRKLEHQSHQFKIKDNQQLHGICQQFAEISETALALEALEGTEKQTKAQEFVKRYLPPELVENESATKSAKKGSEKFEAAKKIAEDMCERHLVAVDRVADKVSEDFLAELSISKPTVETLIASTYTPERKKIADDLFRNAVTSVKGLVERIVKDPNRRVLISDEYDKLEPVWLEKPHESSYAKDEKTGIFKLKSDDVVRIEFLADSAFSDPKLTYFTSLNAYYAPMISRIREHVNVMPGFLLDIEENPHAYFGVLAHEIGHKIGPQISNVNGYDLYPEWQELISCFKQKKSIRLKDNQVDEAIADYIEAEVYAELLMLLPEEQRRPALYAALEAECIFAYRDDRKYSLNLAEAHPPALLRVGGIFGANPSIRAALRCKDDPEKFKTCGLKMTPVASSGQSIDGSDAGNTSNKEGVR